VTSQSGETPSGPTSSASVEELPPTDAGQRSEAASRHTVDRTAVAELDAGWTSYFRYGTVYGDQRAAIESLLDTLGENGYYLKEGACGTGKTLAAVTASVHAMRDPEQLADRAPAGGTFPTYDRTVVVTPVKQQLQQFVGELRGINAALPAGAEPIATVVMRGQADMRAIDNADLPGTDEREAIDELRATTAELIRFNSQIPLDWPETLDPPPHSKVGYDWSDADRGATQARENNRYDPYRARAVRTVVARLTPTGGGEYDRLRISGVETPYPEHVPHSSEVADTDRLQETGYNQLPANLQGRFDPFYAATFAGSQGPGITFADAPNHVVDRDVLFSAAVASGRCPHELMGILAEQAEVILGNYNHLLGPETRRLTDGKLGLLDEGTIAVVDEAHQLEAKSRDGLSTSLDLYTLDRAHNDVRFARHYATGNISDSPTPGLSHADAQAAKRIAKQELGIAAGGLEIEDLIAVEEALTVARQVLLDACADIEGIRFGKRAGSTDPESREPKTNPLVAPQHPEWGDQLTNAVEAEDGISPSVLRTAEPVMRAVEAVYETLAERDVHDRTPQGSAVGGFLRQWVETPRAVYHPEARVQPSAKVSIPERYPEWVRRWTPELRLFNCIPRRELRRVFAELGGGVLMSATLRPAEPFREATGVDAVPKPGAFEDEMQDGDGTTIRANGITDEMVAGHETRSTTFDRFPLRFPPENRLSLVADLPKFTSANRGSDEVYDPAAMTDTRARYAALIRQVAQTEGNILVAMPSYSEAAWAHEFLGTVPTEKRRLLDETSSADETDELLDAFFADGDAVLCTSLRGTITEGVDFDGEKLHTCLSVGVPRVPPSAEMTAVELAYAQAIDTTGGREAAHLIPSTRKVRQSVGRVIRGAAEAGVRLLADERYGSHERNLRDFLSPQQQREFTLVEPDDVGTAIQRFWAQQE
jgi:DNA excision repair protein ERCC-2